MGQCFGTTSKKGVGNHNHHLKRFGDGTIFRKYQLLQTCSPNIPIIQAQTSQDHAPALPQKATDRTHWPVGSWFGAGTC